MDKVPLPGAFTEVPLDHLARSQMEDRSSLEPDLPGLEFCLWHPTAGVGQST